MYGAIIGDMVGSVYEFHPTKKKDFVWMAPHSAPTDDSVMTVAVAEVLLGLNGTESDEEIKDMFIESMRRWGNKYPSAGYGGRFNGWLRSSSMEPYNSYGNGSAMRVSPCGWLYDNMETTRKMARLSAEVTHNHPEGIKGAESVAAAIYMARNGSSKEKIKEYIEGEFGYDLNRTCADIRPGYRFDETCQGSVPESIIAFLDGDSYESVVREAVSLGGDADTQAAIAGSIAEAFYGIPVSLINEADLLIPSDLKDVIGKFYVTIGIYLVDY